MTEQEKRKAAKEFIEHWAGRGKEKQDCQLYWTELLITLFGIKAPSQYVTFEYPLPKGYADAYFPATKVLVEQKALGIDLDTKEPRQGKMVTPYEQARDYVSQMPLQEKPRYIIISNFAEIRIYDSSKTASYSYKTDTWSAPYDVIKLEDLESQYARLSILVDEHEERVKKEMELSLQAGELVGKIHDRFLEQYHDPMAKKTQNSLNILCVRLVFCLYAEDAGLFGNHDAFSGYISQYDPKDIRRALLDLFKVLDTPEDQREDLYLDDELAAFPYVNGGLFARENIEIPKITQEIKDTILESAQFNWAEISPTIFGAVFESTLNPETRRKGGMHYTSIENIHKVIDPLFLDDLKAELKVIEQIPVVKTRRQKLEIFQRKLGSLHFLDPAAGSGNFLTETYLSLRRLENAVIKDLTAGQMSFGDMKNPIQVSISQFYGIEINDFAVTVAKTALWIAESQMFAETEDILYQHMDFLPLKTNANIIEGNALQLNWERIVPKYKLNFIYGNPPFIGSSRLSKDQQDDRKSIFADQGGELDYVACWYKKAANYMKGTMIRAAFVSTNSICQGQQVYPLWKPMMDEGIKINFAYTTFVWDSEASIKAHVYCIIVGFSYVKSTRCSLYTTNEKRDVENINGYLIAAPNIFISKVRKPFGNVPNVVYGIKPADNGYLILDDQEKTEMVKKDPDAEKWIRPFITAREYLHGKNRWCLWLHGMSPSELNKHPEIKKRVVLCRQWREQQVKSGDAYKLKDFPGDSISIIPNASLYLLGVIESNVHMSWMRTVCGRLKGDYRYAGDIVYNTFIWPSPIGVQKQKIEQTAQAILDARALYPDSSLADLYDPDLMPLELRKAHTANDMAVMAAYGFTKGTPEYSSESACVAALMRMYQEKVGKG